MKTRSLSRSVGRKREIWSAQFGEILNDANMVQDIPTLRATCVWKKVVAHVECLLGPEICRQWFRPMVPLVISNGVLILLAKNRFSAYWINSHYQKLVDLLISFQDVNLNCFILSPQDTDINYQSMKGPTYLFSGQISDLDSSIKGATSKVDANCIDQESAN